MAARFWVGGTGTWDASDTTHWAATSNGAGGVSVPGSSDTVTLDASSGGGTVTVNTNPTISSLTMGAYTGTLDFSVNNNSISMVTFSATGTGTRTLKMGTGTWTITGTNWTITTSTNMTLDPGGSTIAPSPSGAFTFAGGGLTYNNLTTSSTQTFTYSGANTFANWTHTPTVALNPSIALAANQTVSGTLTLTATDSATICGRLALAPSLPAVAGITRTVTAAAVVLTNVDFCGIVGAGAATWTGTNLGDAGFNSNITFAAPKTRYWVGNGGSWQNFGSHWASSSGGAAGASQPIPQDTVVFDSSSFPLGGTLTGFIRYLPGLDLSSVTTSVTLNISGFNPGICGDFLMPQGGILTSSATASITLMGAGVHVLKWNSSTNTGLAGLGVNTATGSYTLQDDLTLINGFVFGMGTFDANDNDITISTFSSTGANTRVLSMGSGDWTLTGTSGWTLSGTSLTFDAETSTIILNDSTNTAFPFAGGGNVYYNVWFDRGASTATNTITSANTFNEFKDTGTVAHTIVFPVAITTFTTFTVSGTSGNVMTIQSASAGSQATFAKSGDGYVSCDYLSLKDNNASPLRTWFAGRNSSVVSNVTGWAFDDPPSNSYSLGSGFKLKNFTPSVSTKQFSPGLKVGQETSSTEIITISSGGGVSFGGPGYMIGMMALTYIAAQTSGASSGTLLITNIGTRPHTRQTAYTPSVSTKNNLPNLRSKAN
jgi:hypothetical protein